jgi:hypothetical protein
MTTGFTGYIVNSINIDGTSRNIDWVGGVVPPTVTNTKLSFTFTLIKTANNVFTVLGTATRYGII